MQEQANSPPFNLPLELTSFIGRERETVDVKRLLTSSRLLTLTGAGGCGKTRLALRVAIDRVNDHADGVCWIELAALTDATLVPPVTAKALNLTEQPGRTPTETLLDFLRDKELLLVLDNCEHLLTACAELAQAILRRAANAHILATSREPLAVTGEMLYPVLPLALPPSDRAADIGQFDAIRLFVERARQTLPSFALTTDNAPVVAEICRRLDGIPLAIELASARVNVLSVQQIAARLDDRFAFLTTAPRDASAHHRTLHATIAWSFDLLSTSEQILLRRLAVFTGGCTLDVVEVVCADEHLAREQIAEVLFSLVNKSLVLAETLSSGAARYRFLETIRQYAQEQLNAAGEATQLRDRFLEHFVTLAEETVPKLRGPYQKLWLNWMEREQDNFRSAFEWSLATHQINLGLRIGAALYAFWLPRGYFQEGLHWIEQLLAQTTDEIPGMLRLQAMMVAGHFSGLLGNIAEAVEYVKQAIDLAKAAGEKGKPILAQALLGLGSATRARGDYAAAFDLEQQSEQLYRELGDRAGLEFILQMQGVTVFAMGDYPAARTVLEEALSIAHELNAPYRIAEITNSLGDVARGAQEYGRAQAAYETSLAQFREVDAKRDVASVLHNLGHTHLHQGNVERAQEFFHESLTIQREMNNQNGIAECLRGFAAIACWCGLPLQAASLLAAAEAQSTGMLDGWPAERIEHEYYLAKVRAQLSPTQFERARSEGRSWSLEQAVDCALNLPPSDDKPVPESLHRFGLSARELEIVMFIAEGKSNAEIADQLVLSKRTVEKHVANILAKLDFTNRTQVARWATENALTKPSK